MLSVVYADCHLCSVSHISSQCWVTLCWLSLMLSVTHKLPMLSVVMLSVITLSVIMLSVAAPLFDGEKVSFILAHSHSKRRHVSADFLLFSGLFYSGKWQVSKMSRFSWPSWSNSWEAATRCQFVFVFFHLFFTLMLSKNKQACLLIVNPCFSLG